MKLSSLPCRILLGVVAAILILAVDANRLWAIDIAPMTWTPKSDWVNVKSCAGQTGGANAVGDGVTDDTAAIQAAINYLVAPVYPFNSCSTLYFPPGTYKISSTLNIAHSGGFNFIGCGLNTVITWAGASGAAMVHPDGIGSTRFTGFVWKGNNLAGCAYAHYSHSGYYESDIRHENESFHDFTVPGTYVPEEPVTANYRAGIVPAGAITSGFYGGNQGLTGEVMIYNCYFNNCGTAVYQGYNLYNNYMWHVDGCQFENNVTAIDYFNAGDMSITNCHFENSSNADVIGGRNLHVKHCTSIGSNIFYVGGGGTFAETVQDCAIDSWKNVTGAVTLGRYEQETVFDCKFTNPPAGSLGPIAAREEEIDVMLSNNYAPGIATANLINTNSFYPVSAQIHNLDLIPSGASTGTLYAPTQTFLKTTWPAETANVIDVTASPYSADPTAVTDSTSKIQAAIDAAAAANNNTEVYFPRGAYKISSTLNVSGGNYSLQGAGYFSQIEWWAAGNNTMFTVANPSKFSMQKLQISCLNNVPAGPNYVSTLPTCDPNTITSLIETATGASDAIYDDLYMTSFYAGNPGASGFNTDSPGLVLSNLPAGSTVYMPHVTVPLTVDNCGPAQVFAKFLQMGKVTVSGTAPKTGFFGVLVAEGGQQTKGDNNITINDNQDLVFGGYYSEQCQDDIKMSRGSGTGPGRVTIDGFLSASGTNSDPSPIATVSLNVDNYEGRLFYNGQAFGDRGGAVQIEQTGSNPIDFILANNIYDGNANQAPVITLDTGANLIQTNDEYNDGSSFPANYMPEVPNLLDAAAGISIAQGFDHLRQLEAVDLQVQFGIQQLVSNPAFELDAANPNPTTAIGYNPAGWDVYTPITAGGGARNLTVVSGGSPFDSGNQSMLYVDTTGPASSGIGDRVGSNIGFPASSPDLGAIETFDFRCNSSGTDDDLWFFTGGGPGIHVTCNGTNGRLSANVGGGDTYLGPFLPDVWYRVTVVLGAPSAGESDATLYLTPWYGNGAGPSTSYTIDGVPGVESTGFSDLVLYTGGGVGQPQSINIDNVILTTNAQLFLPPNTGTEAP